MQKPKLYSHTLSVKQQQALPAEPNKPLPPERGPDLKLDFVVGKKGSIQNKSLTGN